MALATYDPLRVSVTFGGEDLTGFGPDTIIKVSRNEDGWSMQVGAGGDVARTRNQNRSGSAEITLMATSPSNDDLTAIAKSDETAGNGIGPFQVKDLNSKTLCSAQNAWVKKFPDMERAKETGVCVWVLDLDRVNMNIGGAADA